MRISFVLILLFLFSNDMQSSSLHRVFRTTRVLCGVNTKKWQYLSLSRNTPRYDSKIYNNMREQADEKRMLELAANKLLREKYLKKLDSNDPHWATIKNNIAQGYKARKETIEKEHKEDLDIIDRLETTALRSAQSAIVEESAAADANAHKQFKKEQNS